MVMDAVLTWCTVAGVLLLFTCCLMWTKSRARLETLKELKEELKSANEEYNRGFEAGRTNSWSHFAVSGDNLKIYLNARPITLPEPAARGVGFWAIDGHVRDMYMSLERLEKAHVLKMYSKDLNRMQEKIKS